MLNPDAAKSGSASLAAGAGVTTVCSPLSSGMAGVCLSFSPATDHTESTQTSVCILLDDSPSRGALSTTVRRSMSIDRSLRDVHVTSNNWCRFSRCGFPGCESNVLKHLCIPTEFLWHPSHCSDLLNPSLKVHHQVRIIDFTLAYPNASGKSRFALAATRSLHTELTTKTTGSATFLWHKGAGLTATCLIRMSFHQPLRSATMQRVIDQCCRCGTMWTLVFSLETEGTRDFSH